MRVRDLKVDCRYTNEKGSTREILRIELYCNEPFIYYCVTGYISSEIHKCMPITFARWARRRVRPWEDEDM